MVRIGLSIGAVLVSLLFPSGRAVAARAIYAYMSPCEALGVACPEGGVAGTPIQTPAPPVADGSGGGGGVGSGPVYDIPPVPAPYVPYAPYVPEILPATPVHSAARPDDRPVGRAPLHPAGVPTEVSMSLLLLAALTATVLPAFRRKYA